MRVMTSGTHACMANSLLKKRKKEKKEQAKTIKKNDEQ